MAERQPSARPRARGLLVRRACFAPAHGGRELADALLGDAREALAALGLASAQVEPIEIQAIRDSMRAGEPTIVVFSDVPALPALSLEGAISALREIDAVVGPCGDGSVYLMGWRAGLDAAVVGTLCDALARPAALAELTDVLQDADLEVELLPPWFRLAGQTDLSVVECMARLSAMSESGEDDFAAERLRQWFERFATEG